MASKLSNSWNLVKASAAVLSKDKELFIFPILSAIGTALITLVFFLPMAFGNMVDTLFSDQFRIATYAVIFVFYVIQYSVVFFSNTALVGAAMIRLKGGDPTVGDGLRIAGDKFTSILGYAVIAATVGVLLKAASDRSRGLGRVVVSLLGMSWNLATFLVVPILAIENVGPIEAVKRSTSLLKQTWGEQIAGNLGMGAVFTLLTIAALIVGVGLTVLTAVTLEIVWVPVLLAMFTVLVLVAIGLVNSTLNGIYAAAVYQYATTGRSEGFFDAQLVENTFRSA